MIIFGQKFSDISQDSMHLFGQLLENDWPNIILSISLYVADGLQESLCWMFVTLSGQFW